MFLDHRCLDKAATGAGVGTAETTPAEQSIGGLISTSHKPPPSPLTDWSEIEVDARCMTAVTRIFLQASEESSIVVTTIFQEC